MVQEQLHNSPCHEWPPIHRIDFFFNDGDKSFLVGKTRGPEGDNSFVHSIRPSMEGDHIRFYVYYVADGKETFWQSFWGVPNKILFNTREGHE